MAWLALFPVLEGVLSLVLLTFSLDQHDPTVWLWMGRAVAETSQLLQVAFYSWRDRPWNPMEPMRCPASQCWDWFDDFVACRKVVHINHIALIWGNLIKIDDNVLELGANPIFRQTPAPLRLEGRRAIKCLAFALGLQCQAFKCKDFFFPHGVCNWACRSQVQMFLPTRYHHHMSTLQG